MTRLLGILLILLSALTNPLHAASDGPDKLLILLPEINATYNRIFGEILTGIAAHNGVSIYAYSLTKDSKKNDIQNEIDNNQIDAIIALGHASYNISKKFQDQLPVIHGGMVITPNGHSGISLVGSPTQFFAHLKNIAPNVKRVFTVYNEKNSGWLIRIAEEEALKLNIELRALEASDIRSAARNFKTILSEASSTTDAIWLLFDKVVPNQTILPLALDAVWKKNIILFSNNPAYTKRGALFSLFPDYEKMGYSLAEFSKKQINTKTPLVIPLSSLKVSVNERTASHLGLNHSSGQRASFDIIYPLR